MKFSFGRMRLCLAMAVISGIALLADPALAGVSLPYQVIRTVSTGSAPVEQTFTPTAAQAGSIDVNVVDGGFPAPLSALRVAVTQGTTVLKTAAANAGAPASLKLTFTATAGTAYVIRLVGRPDAKRGTGSAIVSLNPAGLTTTTYATFAAAFQAPIAAGAVAGGILPDQSLTFPEAGTYTATLTDFALPAAFQALFVKLCPAPCTDPTQDINIPVGSGSAPGVVTFSIGAANTQLTLKSIAASAGGGLFGLRIVGGPSNNVVYPANAGASGLTAIGNVSVPANVANPSTQPVTLTVSDLVFPKALSTLGAVLTTADGRLIARQCVTSCGVADVLTASASAGNLLLWRSAVAGSGAGSYVVSVASGATSLYSDAGSVAPAGTAAPTTYTLPFTAPTTGNFTVAVTDLQAPAGLPSLQFAVVQGSVTVAQSATAGTVTAPLAAGAASLVVVATTASGGSGIFGAQVSTTDKTPVSLLSTSQAVGTFTGAQSLSITGSTASTYDVTLADLQWPVTFQTLNVFITQGSQIVGKVYGGGTLTLNLTAGTYGITYSAVPDPTEQAGLYALLFQASAPPSPVPTVALSVDSSAIGTGQSVHLSWTSTNATSCSATGGWTGTQLTTGTSVAAGPLTADTTFTLTCTGAGGTSTPASVTVTVSATPPTSGKSGGGGGMDWLALAALSALGLMRRRSAA